MDRFEKAVTRSSGINRGGRARVNGQRPGIHIEIRGPADTAVGALCYAAGGNAIERGGVYRINDNCADDATW